MQLNLSWVLCKTQTAHVTRNMQHVCEAHARRAHATPLISHIRLCKVHDTYRDVQGE